MFTPTGAVSATDPAAPDDIANKNDRLPVIVTEPDPNGKLLN